MHRPPIRVVDMKEIDCPFNGGVIEELTSDVFAQLTDRARRIPPAIPRPLPAQQYDGADWTIVDTAFGCTYLVLRAGRPDYLLLDIAGGTNPTTAHPLPALRVTLQWEMPVPDDNTDAALRHEIVTVLGVVATWLDDRAAQQEG